jgi:hypothetical protein
MGTRASKISLVAVALEQLHLNPTRSKLMKSLRKTDAIATELGIRHNTVQEMIGIRVSKYCVCWVPRLLTEDHKVQ